LDERKKKKKKKKERQPNHNISNPFLRAKKKKKKIPVIGGVGTENQEQTHNNTENGNKERRVWNSDSSSLCV
jgi:hypothetical protein